MEGRHLQQLEEEGRVLLRVVVELNISLASVFFPWNLRFLERDYSYEQRHRQGRAAVEGRRLCSSLRRRQEEEEEGLRPGVVVGHLKRQQEVCEGQSTFSTSLFESTRYGTGHISRWRCAGGGRGPEKVSYVYPWAWANNQ